MLENYNEIIDAVFREVMKLDDCEISDDMSYDNMDTWDSLSSMNLMLRLEEELKLHFTFDDIIQIENLGDIRRLVGEKVAQ